METEIPSEVRRSIDDEAARWDMISSEVTSASLRKSAKEYCASENQHHKNLREAVFWFHAGIVAIELRFGQQVAAEALKNIHPHFAAEIATAALVPDYFTVMETNLAASKGRKNRYVECDAIDSRSLVRTGTTHLCLDSQFNLPGLIIPIGINIYDVPRRESSRHNVTDLCLGDRSCRNCSNELSVSELGSDQHTEGFFRCSDTSPLRSYSQRRIKLSIDDEEMVRIVGTRHSDIHLLKVLDLCNFDCHLAILNSSRLR
jgi:hypothetical protein